MEYLLYWTLIGWVGGILATYEDYTNGVDFTVKHCLVGLLISAFLGPLMIFVVFHLHMDKVLIKGKK